MKEWLNALVALPSQIAQYPSWVQAVFAATFVMVVASAVLWFFQRPADTKPDGAQIETKQPAPQPQASQPPSTPTNSGAPKVAEKQDKPKREQSQNAQLQGSPGAQIYQSGRDIIVHAPAGGASSNAAVAAIHSITVEVRLTCDLKGGVELPPGEVPFMPVSDAAAYFDGPAGRARLAFVSPVIFRRIEGDRIVVINRFALESASDLIGRPRAHLANYSSAKIPVMTIVWGKALEKIRLLEVTVSLNGADPVYQSFQYDVPFQEGPVFDVPLAPILQRLK